MYYENEILHSEESTEGPRATKIVERDPFWIEAQELDMQAASIVNRRYRNFPKAAFMFEDSLSNITADIFTDTGVSITPDNGVNLIFARANASAGDAGVSPVLRATYNGAELGRSDINSSSQGGHWNGNEIGVMKVVDTSGLGEVKIQGHSNSPVNSTDIGAQQIISIPLGTMGLVEGVDYWYQEESDDTPFDIVWGDSGTDIKTAATLNWTAPENEAYLAFWYAEGAIQQTAGLGAYAVYFYEGENNITSHNMRSSGGIADFVYHSHAWAQAISISAGPASVSVRPRIWNQSGGTTAHFRRSRMLVIRASSILQGWGVGGQQEAAFPHFDPVTHGSGNAFATIPGYTQTYTPSVKEQVIVMAMMASESYDITPAKPAVPTYVLRDDTEGVDYATDFGEMINKVGNDCMTIAFAVKETSEPTTWKIKIRDANDNGVAFKDTPTKAGSENIHGLVLIFGLANKT